MKQTLMEAEEGQRGTHMGFINAVVPVSNHVIDWSARLGASLTRTRDKRVIDQGWIVELLKLFKCVVPKINSVFFKTCEYNVHKLKCPLGLVVAMSVYGGVCPLAMQFF